MPRNSRVRSPINCYHVVSRGINKQDIFFDNQDKEKFLKELMRTKEKYEYILHAYVLMPNHVHLLVTEKDNSISTIMGSLLTSYAEYINKKYNRIGYVFQDRFSSKAIEDDSYLKNVIRYIHLNPQKAGITQYSKYKWSSYQAYMGKQNALVTITEDIKNKFITSANMANKFENLQEKFRTSFQQFHEEKSNQNSDEEIINFELRKVLEDEELYAIIKEKTGEEVHNLHRLQKEYRDKILKEIFKIKGTNCAQISRVTGINIKLVTNCREKFVREKRLAKQKNNNDYK